MTYFKNVATRDDLKKVYRRLALLHHPDKGGNISIMQHINREYAELASTLGHVPKSLLEVKVGNVIFVNNTQCIVTEVDKGMFKARSMETGRESYFSKTTGFAMLNFKFKATVCQN